MPSWDLYQMLRISIHALLAESDVACRVIKRNCCNFYPRSPCGERRSRDPAFRYSSTFLSTLSLRRATGPGSCFGISALFLSTLSLRRATSTVNCNLSSRLNFYPRSPCGERPGDMPMYGTGDYISIHALLAESDHANRYYVGLHLEFLSTLSLRRATISRSP